MTWLLDHPDQVAQRFGQEMDVGRMVVHQEEPAAGLVLHLSSLPFSSSPRSVARWRAYQVPRSIIARSLSGV